MLIVLFYTIKYLAIAYVVLFFLLSLSGNNSTRKKNRIIFTIFIGIILLLYELYNYLNYGSLPISEIIVYGLLLLTLGLPIYGIIVSKTEEDIKAFWEMLSIFGLIWIVIFTVGYFW